MPPAPLLLSVEEGAAQLRIGRSRMFELIRLGEVLSVKVGGSRRIPYDSLQAYVKKLVTEQAGASDPQPDAIEAGSEPFPKRRPAPSRRSSLPGRGPARAGADPAPAA